MSRIGNFARRLGPLMPAPIVERAYEWRDITRAMMPSATWPRDLRRAAAATALYQRLEADSAADGGPGRVSLASLRADLDASTTPGEVDPLAWIFFDDEPASLWMRPGDRIVYRLRDSAGARVESRLVAEGHSDPDAGLRFVVEIVAADGREPRRAERRLAGPGEGTIAAISVPLPDTGHEELILSLALEATGEGSPGTGRWLDPCLTARRREPASSVARLSTSPPRRARIESGAVPGSARGSERPRFSFLLPVHDPKPVFLDRALSSVLRQTDPGWELCLFDDGSVDPVVRELLAAHVDSDPRVRVARSDTALGISGATNRALAMADGEFVLLLDHDDEIAADAVASFVQALGQFPDADILYTDEATVDEANRWQGNLLKPAWSPAFFESNMYSCHLAAIRRELVERAGGMRSEFDGSQDYDLILRLSEGTDRIVHVPGVRYFWRFHPESASAGAKPYALDAARGALEEHFERIGRPADVSPMRLAGCYRRQVSPAAGRVVAVLPVTPELEPGSIATCVAEIRAAGADELVLAAAGSAGVAVCEAAGGDAKVVEGPAAATRAQLADLGASASDAEWILLVAEPVEGASPDWLAELLTAANGERIAIAGSLGISPSGRIEHAGVAIAAGVPLVAELDHELAYDNPDRVSATQSCVRDVLATSGTVVVSRAAFESLGGLSPAGLEQHAEVDLCLRALARGDRVVVTPHARLRRVVERSSAATTSLRELFEFQGRWWSSDTDPYYHPSYCRQRATLSSPHRPEPGGAWRAPRSGDAKPATETAPPGPRDELADTFVVGEGIEIGPLHSPLRMPPAASVRYVDRMPVTLLRRHYPELDELPLVEIDVGDDGEQLATIEDESQDFVVANHLLEHTEDPISTIANWLRVLRPGGVIYMAVPDKRHTFDIDREPTPVEHMIRDYEVGPEGSRREHFEDWARHVERVSEERVGERADVLQRIGYSIHTHVFTERTLIELLVACDRLVGPIEIEAMRRNGIETLVVLRKPDPAAAPPEPPRAYETLPMPS
jgi:GT2 family glycosyltransferase/SAM-dependent methyltransferase